MLKQKAAPFVLIGLVTAIAVFLAIRYVRPSPPATLPPAPLQNTSPQTMGEDEALWNDLIPQIISVLQSAPEGTLGGTLGLSRPVRIFAASDITGDGIPEALVDIGDGGAYTVFLVLMQIKNGLPVLAHMSNGAKDLQNHFVAGASVKNGTDATLYPLHEAVVQSSYSIDDDLTVTSCAVEAFVWNESTQAFIADPATSAMLATLYCAQVQTSVSAPSGFTMAHVDTY